MAEKFPSNSVSWWIGFKSISTWWTLARCLFRFATWKVCSLDCMNCSITNNAYPWLDFSTHPASSDAFMHTHVVYQTSLIFEGLEANLTRNDGVNSEVFKVSYNKCEYYKSWVNIDRHFYIYKIYLFTTHYIWHYWFSTPWTVFKCLL